MAATWPARTWSPGELVTAANMNLQRDQINELRTTIGAGPGTLTTINSDLQVNGKATISGLLTANALGRHTFTGTGGAMTLAVSNPGSSPTNLAMLALGNDTSPDLLDLYAFSSGYVTGSLNFANGATIWVQAAGGLTVGTAATLRLAAGGAVQMRVWPSGGVSLGGAADPGAGCFALPGTLQGGSLGVAYNTRLLTLWGSDPVSGVVATLVSNVSGRPSVLQFSDGYTYNMAIGGDGAGSFTIWANRYVGVAGTALFAVSQAGNLQLNGSGNISGNLTVQGALTVTAGNLAFKNVDNNFVAQTIGSYSWISGANAALYFRDTSGPVNQRIWRLIQYGDGHIHFDALNDALAVTVTALILYNNGNVGTGPITGASIYMSQGGNNLADLTCRGGTNFQNGLSVNAGNITGNGIVQIAGYVYPGRVDVSGGQQQGSWILGSHGSFGLYSNTGLYCVGNINAAGNVQAAAGFYEYSRGTAQGTYINYYPALGGATLTAMTACGYTLIGKTCVFNFYLTFTTQNTTLVTISLPGLTCAMYGGCPYSTTPGLGGGMIQTTPGGTTLNLYRDTLGSGNWGGGSWTVVGTITFAFQ